MRLGVDDVTSTRPRVRYATPGVYYEAIDSAERTVRAVRTDIAGFVGVASRGPVGQAVLVTSWRQFESAFGGLHADAFLGYAVRAFFDNGGRDCYVVRAAAPPARAQLRAGVTQPTDGETSLVEPAGLVAGAVVTLSQSDEPVITTRVIQAIDPLSSRLTWSAPLPGSVRLDRTIIIEGPAGLVTVSSEGVQPADRTSTIVRSIAGLAVGDVSLIRQTERTSRRNVRLAAVEAAGARLVWDEPLAPYFDLTRAFDLASGSATADAMFHSVLGEPLVHVEASSPGSWGNGLFVRLHIAVGAATLTTQEAQPADRLVSIVRDVSGIQAGDLVRVIQPGARPAVGYLLVGSVAPLARRIVWSAGRIPESFDLRQRVDVERVDFSIAVYVDVRLRELFTRLSLLPTHPRYIRNVINEDTSALISVTSALERGPGQPIDLLPYSSGRWLESGRDGLAGLTSDDLIGRPGSEPLAGLAVLERVSEVSILVAPDAHLRPGPPQLLQPEPPPGDPCLPCAPVALAPPPPPRPIERAPRFTAEDTYRVQAAMLEQCERLRYRFAVLDAPEEHRIAPERGVQDVREWRKRFESPFGALYSPWLVARDHKGDAGQRLLPPGGHVAGLYARLDLIEGVHRPPANGALESVQALSLTLDDTRHGLLNDESINAIRAIRGRGIRVLGARTLGSDPLWRYVNVRRLLSAIEKSIEVATQWTVFEDNDLEFRELLRMGISSFLETIWARGALVGERPEDAFFVRCDGTNNPPQRADLGQVLVDVGVAPSVPAEFVVFRVGRTSDELRVVELAERVGGG
jgi:phage tail sheath protein FI